MEGMMGDSRLDDGLFVKFSKRAVEMKAKSEEKGYPVFDEIDFISIIVAGDPTNQVERKVRDDDKRRFAPIWEKYKNGEKGTSLSGMPIEQWASISLTEKAMLKHIEFHTVESLAAASDSSLQRVGMGGFELRAKAKAFLEAAGDSSAIQKYAAENKRLKDDLEALKLQVAELATVKRTRGPNKPK